MELMGEPVTTADSVIIPGRTLLTFREGVRDTGITVVDTPLLEDFNLDGELELLLPREGGIQVINQELEEVAFFQVDRPYTPILVDVNSDYRTELVVAWRDGITCFTLEGEVLWNRELRPLTPPAAAYLGLSDWGSVVVLSDDGLVSLDLRTGELEWSSHVDAKPIPPVMHDVNGDSIPEIFVASRGLEVLDGRGRVLEVIEVDPVAYPSIFDVNGDGRLEVVVPAEDGLYVLPGLRLELKVNTPATIADVDGDGWQEILVGSEDGLIMVDEGEGYVYRLGKVLTVPVMVDLDGDGCSEVVILSERGLFINKGG